MHSVNSVLSFLCFACLVALVTGSLQTRRTEVDENSYVDFDHPKFLGRRLQQAEDGTVRVMITYKNDRGRSIIQSHQVIAGADFADLKTLAGTMTMDDLQALAADDDIIEIAEDKVMRAASQMTPLGVRMTQCDGGCNYNTNDVPLSSSTSASCSDPSSFKIGLVDAGLSVSHPDIPCGLGADCVGQSFGGAGSWDESTYTHGTFIQESRQLLRNPKPYHL